MDDPSLTAAQRVAGLRALPAVDLLDFAVKNGVLGGWGGTLQPGGMFEVHPELSFRDGDWDRGVKEWVLGSCEDEGALFVRALPGKVRPYLSYSLRHVLTGAVDGNERGILRLPRSITRRRRPQVPLSLPVLRRRTPQRTSIPSPR